MKAFITAGLLLLSLHAHALREKDKQVILDKLDDYDVCQDHGDSDVFCQDALDRWVDAHPGDAFAAAKKTRAKVNSHGALPLFAKAFEAKKGDCKDQDVILAVTSGLAQPADSKWVPLAKKIAFEHCEKEMRGPVLKAGATDSGLMLNICHEVQDKKWAVLTAVQKKKCK